MQATLRPHGHIADAPDPRDHVAAVPKAWALPQTHDLRYLCPPIYDQGPLGSCTAHAIAAALEIELRAAGLPNWMPSRLFLYYNERAPEHTLGKDAGGQLRDGLKGLARLGACPEVLWPYDVKKFKVRPGTACYEAAHPTRARKYERLVHPDPDALEQVLFAGKPVMFGFSVFEGFESPRMAETGLLKLPGKHEAATGGHAVLCVGYDRPNQRFLIRNSWGTGWGLGGYFWMPYAYLCDPKLARDFWVVESLVR